MSQIIQNKHVNPSGSNTSRSIPTSRSTYSTASTPPRSFFAGNRRDSELLPYNVRRYEGKNGRSATFEAAGRGFSNSKDSFDHVDTKFVACPLTGRPVPIGPRNIQILCRYLKNHHEDVFDKLRQDNGGRKIENLFVYDDCYSLTRRFRHYDLPGKTFSTLAELSTARKTERPTVWHQETMCNHGDECRGKTGGCDYNHPEAQSCEFDTTPDRRCNRIHCADNHGRGRVKYAIARQNRANGGIVSTPEKATVSKTPSAPIKAELDQGFHGELDCEVDEARMERLVSVTLDNEFAECDDGFITVTKKSKKSSKVVKIPTKIVKIPTKVVKITKASTKALPKEPYEDPLKELNMADMVKLSIIREQETIKQARIDKELRDQELEEAIEALHEQELEEVRLEQANLEQFRLEQAERVPQKSWHQKIQDGKDERAKALAEKNLFAKLDLEVELECYENDIIESNLVRNGELVEMKFVDNQLVEIDAPEPVLTIGKVNKQERQKKNSKKGIRMSINELGFF